MDIDPPKSKVKQEREHETTVTAYCGAVGLKLGVKIGLAGDLKRLCFDTRSNPSI